MSDKATEFLQSLGLPDDPDDLLTPEERDALNQHLQAMAWQRRRTEAESRNVVISAPPVADERTEP